MTQKLRLIAVAAAFAAASGAAEAATVRFDRMMVLGDSLSDVGNAHELSLGLAPESPPYDRLRFSNGKIWYDHVAAVIEEAGGRARNYAYGGAHAIGDRDQIPDLQDQRRRMVDNVTPRDGDLAAIWIGGNDLLERVGRDNMRNVARNAADQVFDAARALQRNGFDTAMIFNMPNLADIPRYAGASAADRNSARGGSRAYNERLDARIDQLRGRGMQVIEVDVYGLFADVVANPGSYGIENLTTPCIRGGRDRCSGAEARVTAFADDIHPSAALHRILADHVLGLLAPETLAGLLDGAAATAPAARAPSAEVAAVPAPAPGLLLVAGLGVLGAAARRRAAGRARGHPYPFAPEAAM